MNKRYKITRLDEQGNPLLTMEEIQAFFATQTDFEYKLSYTASNKEGVHMTLKGDFFMWQKDGVEIPFRLFDGEIYVAVSQPVIMDKMVELAEGLKAIYVEG